MPFDLTALDAHLGMMHDDMPFTLTYSGDDYTFNEVSMTTLRVEFMDTQVKQSILRVAAIQASDFTILPDRDEKVTIDSVVHRILEIQDSPDGGLERRLFLGKEFQ